MTPELGVCYYPEHWDEALWAEDAARMVATGISWVRIGEFAWSRLEPTSGSYDWAWLGRAIETLGAAGLKVVLGTPTATPPRWMLDRHPDMLALDADGRPRGFGSRRHYCFSHEGYLADCRRIVTALAKRYGANRHVAAWQTDNEYGCHDTTLSYSAAARDGFRNWLAQRYQSPDALNRAWGNVFWSMEYADFSEVGLPNLTVTEPNPAHAMDFRRYSSDMVVRFNRVQAEILRAHSDAPLIHNYMGNITDFDHFAVGADLDIASWDSYPLGFLLDRVDTGEAERRRYARQGDPDFQAFHHDLYRAVGGGRWWVMEQQPGPVNWAPWNPAPLPGMVRLWSLEAIAHGAEVVSYFRWRQAPFAQEQMHAGLLRPDSAPAPGLGEAAAVVEDITALGEVRQEEAPVALVFDYPSAWAWDIQPQGRDFSYLGLAFDAYRALRRAGLSVDILPPDTERLAGYPLVLIPGLFAWTDTLRAVVERHTGVVLAGPRTGSKTADFSIPVPLPPAMPGLDLTVTRVESLAPGIEIEIEGGGLVRRWFEHLEGPAPGLLRSAAGDVLAMEGKRAYLAGWLDAAGWDRAIGLAAGAAGLEVDPLPEGLRIRDCASHRFAFNYAPEPRSYNGRTLEPGGVAWWPR
ncbi:MAG: beta-galactosidase [Paracoccaceae bacterium]|nr:beta-galactosidase [Paracoccaceae bacterium]